MTDYQQLCLAELERQLIERNSVNLTRSQFQCLFGYIQWRTHGWDYSPVWCKGDNGFASRVRFQWDNAAKFRDQIHQRLAEEVASRLTGSTK